MWALDSHPDYDAQGWGFRADTTLEGPTEYVSECMMDSKVYMDSYMVSNGSRWMVTWTIFKNRLLEVGLTQNQETMVLQTLAAVNWFSCVMCEDVHE